MRLAFLSDIHGNYYALKAVLKYMTREDEPAYDRLICLGDILAGHGGNEKVIELLDQYDVELIKGNHDGRFVPWDTMASGREKVERLHKWEDENVSPEILERLENLPITRKIRLEDGRTLLAFHSNPENLWEVANSGEANTEKMKKVFGNLAGDVLVYGHYHRSHVMWFAGKILVNASSVSGYASLYPDEFARFTSIESLPDRLTIRQEVVPYDTEAQVRMDEDTDCTFAQNWL